MTGEYVNKYLYGCDDCNVPASHTAGLKTDKAVHRFCPLHLSQHVAAGEVAGYTEFSEYTKFRKAQAATKPEPLDAAALW